LVEFDSITIVLRKVNFLIAINKQEQMKDNKKPTWRRSGRL